MVEKLTRPSLGQNSTKVGTPWREQELKARAHVKTRSR